MEQGIVVLSPDKTATISYSGGIDYGMWVAENDRLCISWVRLEGGGKQCVTFFKIDENKYRVFEPSGRFFSVNLEQTNSICQLNKQEKLFCMVED